jgi:hypothetical protein
LEQELLQRQPRTDTTDTIAMDVLEEFLGAKLRTETESESDEGLCPKDML